MWSVYYVCVLCVCAGDKVQVFFSPAVDLQQGSACGDILSSVVSLGAGAVCSVVSRQLLHITDSAVQPGGCTRDWSCDHGLVGERNVLCVLPSSLWFISLCPASSFFPASSLSLNRDVISKSRNVHDCVKTCVCAKKYFYWLLEKKTVTFV